MTAAIWIVAAGALFGIAWNAVRDNGIYAAPPPAAPVEPVPAAPVRVERSNVRTQARAGSHHAVSSTPAVAPDTLVTKTAVPPPAAPVRVIDLLEARNLVAQGAAKFVDARSANNFVLGHIPRAFNIPSSDFDAGWAKVKAQLSPGDRIVVYCTSADCDEAEMVIARLLPLGYTQLLHFKGGWADWENARMPQETGPGPAGK